jgi:hypothetical protein
MFAVESGAFILPFRAAREIYLFFYLPDITEFAAGEHPRAYDL